MTGWNRAAGRAVLAFGFVLLVAAVVEQIPKHSQHITGHQSLLFSIATGALVWGAIVAGWKPKS